MAAKYIVTVNVVVIDKESGIAQELDYNSYGSFSTTRAIVAVAIARFLEGILVQLPAIDEEAVFENEISDALNAQDH